MGQAFQRISPQAAQGTILIDRDTDLTNLKEQALYAYRNIDNDEINTVRAVQLLFESFKAALKESKITIVNTQGDTLTIKLCDSVILQLTAKTGNLIQDISRLVNRINLMYPDLKFKDLIEKEIQQSLWNKPTKDRALELISTDLGLSKYPVLNQEIQSLRGVNNNEALEPTFVDDLNEKLIRIAKKINGSTSNSKRKKLLAEFIKTANSSKSSVEAMTLISKGDHLKLDSLYSGFLNRIQDGNEVAKVIPDFISALKLVLETIEKNRKVFRNTDKDLVLKIKKYAKIALNSYEIWKEFLDKEKPESPKNIDLEKLLQVVIRQLSEIDNIIDIPEVQRIEAISEIVFGLKRSIGDLNLTDNISNDTVSFFVTIANDTLVNFNQIKDSSVFVSMQLILKNLYDYLQRDLINRLGSDHPSVEHFGKIYADLQNAFDTFYKNKKEDNDSYALHGLLNEKIVYLIQDLKVLYDLIGKLDKSISSENELESKLEVIENNLKVLKFKTRIGQTIEQELRKNIKELIDNIRKRIKDNPGAEMAKKQWENLRKAQDIELQVFLKKYIIETMQTIIIQYVEKQAKQAIKDTKRFAWLNNLTVTDSAEFSTTVLYSLVKKKKVGLDLSANFFHNPSTNFNENESKADSMVENQFGKQIILGLTFKKTGKNEKCEVGANFAASSDITSSFNGFFDGNVSKPDLYFGLYYVRPIFPKSKDFERIKFFTEVERQVRPMIEENDLQNKSRFLNAGIEIKFGKTFLFDGLFVVAKRRMDRKQLLEGEEGIGWAIGLTFPIVQ